jgi:hypothetical protein
MSPEFDTFVGTPIREMRPGREGHSLPHQLLHRRLPQNSFLDLSNRRDVPYPVNLKFGKALYDRKVHGFHVPYFYAIFKDMNRAVRNDRVLTHIKSRTMISSGFKNPPAGFTPIPDPEPQDHTKKHGMEARLAAIKGKK